jgi:RNA polymerase sigma-70 factor (ECF subfamily)
MARTERPPLAEIGHQLDLLSRRERGRLIAGLVGRFGHRQLELAEDVAQEALLTALATWPYSGIPDNPAAWLTRVARNKALDRLRRGNREQVYDADRDDRAAEDESSPPAGGIADPDLRLMFLCAHPGLTGLEQLTLTLRIVSGFTGREIAEIFLSTDTAVAQRLSRSKRKLTRLDAPLVEHPTAADIESRLGTVLKVVYLMFSLGYAPRSGAQLIRRDVALEALRLARELADRTPTATPTSKALAALLCFQASRFDAREDAHGNPALLSRQNRADWDTTLIDVAIGYLREAMTGRDVSRYHLEAGIASVYATAPSWSQVDWGAILTCYERLERITDSPVVAVNACVAQAFAGQPEPALHRLDTLGRDRVMHTYAPFHIARAEVLRLLGREAEAGESYRAAIKSGASVPILRHLEQRLATSL